MFPYSTQNSTIGGCSLSSNDSSSSTDSGIDNAVNDSSQEMDENIYVQVFDNTVQVNGSLSVKEAIDKIIEKLEINFDGEKIKKDNFFAITITHRNLQLQLSPENKLAESKEQMLDLFKTKKVLNQCKIECGNEQNKQEVSFKLCRNGFLSIKSETKITNCKLLEFLYREAKEKIEKNIYPVSTEKLLELNLIEKDLQGLNCSEGEPLKQTSICDIVEKVYDDTKYKNAISKIFLKRKMIKYAKKEQDKLKRGNCERDTLYKQYLSICREIKSYGGFVFEGQMERSIMETILHLEYEDKKVFVSVNEQGFHIINKECPKVMLDVPLQELYYSLYTPEKSKHFPCLYFKNAESNLQQIFSHHAYFIDKVLKKLIDDHKRLCKVT